MKSKTITALSIVLAIGSLGLVGCKGYDFISEKLKVDKIDDIKVSEEIVIESSKETENQKEVATQETDATNKETPAKPVEESKTNEKFIEVNGNTYSVPYYKTKDSSINAGRKLNVYRTENRDVTLRYDTETGDLLWANFNNLEISENKITENQAKKIGIAFLKRFCDLSKYKADEIEIIDDNDGGYMISYSKHISGYKSDQYVYAMVTADGKIEAFYHNKFAFENINTNVKINNGEMKKKLIERIKELGYDKYKYKIIDTYVLVTDNQLCLSYKVDFLDKTDDRSLIGIEIVI